MNVVHAARLRKGRVIKYIAADLPWQAFSFMPFDKKRSADRERPRRPDKVHPKIKEWLRKRGGNEVEEILVTFHDELTIPRFPDPDPRKSRSADFNKRCRREAARLVADIVERRAGGYRATFRSLAKEHKTKVVEPFWLISGARVKMPISAVRKLAKRDDIAYIEPRYPGDVPPQNANANDDVADGRARIASDPYFGLGLTGGFIGLLDTGVRFTHVQFNSPSHIDFRRDCVNGGATCTAGPGFDPTDDSWNHGTCSAAIITGNARQGADFRGVTGITLDSFKIYPGGGGFLDANAAVRAFQVAVSVLDRVIVAEMQGSGDDLSAISAAADAAFDAGAVVIAANGNNGPAASTVNTPANAHRVIGVGDFDVQTQNQINGQSRGPAPDGRFKPDIQAPTQTETASSASNTAFKTFGGTSGATPYAAGAAALLRNWLRGTSGTIDPGQVYAQLILSGQQPYPFNNTTGAGPLRLPTDGWAWWGKTSVSNGQTIDIPLGISGANANTLDGALWWPETAVSLPFFGRFEIHNDVDLHLVDPRNVVRASSISIPSVFERARVSGAIRNGTWKLRIRGYNVSGTQTVYWAAHVRLA
jgi:serine protease AprX